MISASSRSTLRAASCLPRLEYANRIATWEKWDNLALLSQGEKGNRKAT